MQLGRSLKYLHQEIQDSVIAIGNFDGVHKGHCALIQEAKKTANKYRKKLTIFSFYPHPRQVIYNQQHLNIIGLRQKYELCKNLGIDTMLLLRFTHETSCLTPGKFLELFFLRHTKPYGIFVGIDYKFGHQRTGDVTLLQNTLQTFGIKVWSTANKMIDDVQKYSSSAIRQKIALGAIAEANNLLGYEYYIEGHIAHGKKIGNTIGFPTANISLHNIFLPKFGVYVVRIKIDSDMKYGVASIGQNPTLPSKQPVLEVHIFNFCERIYGKICKVYLLKFLRAEEKFKDIESLKKQIALDAQQAQAYLNSSLSHH